MVFNSCNVVWFFIIYSIEIYDDSAKIQASGSSDDDEELLGGHFIEAYIEKEDLNLENIVLDWYLS